MLIMPYPSIFKSIANKNDLFARRRITRTTLGYTFLVQRQELIYNLIVKFV